MTTDFEEAELQEEKAREAAALLEPRLVVAVVTVENDWSRGRPTHYTFSINTDCVDEDMRFPEHLLDVAFTSTQGGLAAHERLSDERSKAIVGETKGEPWAVIWFDGEIVVETRSWEALEDYEYWRDQEMRRRFNP